MTAIYSQLVAGCVTLVSALSLTINSLSVTVEKLALPLVRDQIENLPIVLICPDEKPESTEPLDTGNNQLVSYVVQFVIVAQGNRDAVTVLDDMLLAREKIRKTFQRPAGIQATVSAVLTLEVLPDTPINHTAYAENLTLGSLAVRFKVVESAT